MLTFSASVESLQPPQCDLQSDCTPATTGQNAFLFIALAFIAVGTGGIKPCVSAFGADQFDESDEKEAGGKSAFFNWFFFAISMGFTFRNSSSILHTRQGRMDVGIRSTHISHYVVNSDLGVWVFLLSISEANRQCLHTVRSGARGCYSDHYKGVKVTKLGVLYDVSTKESDIVGGRKIAHSSRYRYVG